MDMDRLVSPFLMWAIVICGGGLSYLLLPHALLYQPGAIHLAVFALAIVNWLALLTSSMLCHRQVLRSAASIERLVTSGPYRYVRHPIYSADMMAIWGALIAFPAVWLLLGALWATAVMSAWAVLEERALSKRFGTAYVEYRKKTPMLLPDYPGALRSLTRSSRR
jgi:protein-S-isoprenylcysteine O-methyltransferase Ste14